MFFASDNKKIFSNLEIFGIFLAFLIALYLLLPSKDDLAKRVLSEKKNYDLTMAYIESLLKVEPNNRKLLFGLIEAASKSNKRDLALELIDTLKKSANSKEMPKLISTKYHILWKEYKEAKKASIKKILLKRLKESLKEMSKYKKYMLKDANYWYYHLNRAHLYLDAYRLSILKAKSVKETKEAINWYKKALWASFKINSIKDKLNVLEALAKLDKDNQEKWLSQIYYIFTAKKDFKDAFKILNRLKSISSSWVAERARLFLYLKEYKKASSIYKNLFKSAESYKDKKRWFKEAVSSMLQGHLFKEAINFIQSNEDIFLNDANISSFILSVYLQTGALDEGAKFADKLLQQES